MEAAFVTQSFGGALRLVLPMDFLASSTHKVKFQRFCAARSLGAVKLWQGPL